MSVGVGLRPRIGPREFSFMSMGCGRGKIRNFRGVKDSPSPGRASMWRGLFRPGGLVRKMRTTNRGRDMRAGDAPDPDRMAAEQFEQCRAMRLVISRAEPEAAGSEVQIRRWASGGQRDTDAGH